MNIKVKKPKTTVNVTMSEKQAKALFDLFGPLAPGTIREVVLGDDDYADYVFDVISSVYGHLFDTGLF